MSDFINIMMFLFPFTLGVLWPLLHHRLVSRARLQSEQTHAISLWLFLLVSVLSLQIAQHYFATLYRGTLLGLPVNAGSDILFPLTLVILLYLCVVRRPPEFRRVCLLVLVVNAGISAWSCILRQGWVDPNMSIEHVKGLWAEKSTSKILLGGMLTVCDAFLMVVVYRMAAYRTNYRGLRIAIPLLAGLGLDAFGFAWIETAFGVEKNAYGPELVGQITAKWAIGLVYSALMYAYLRSPSQLLEPNEIMGTLEFLKRMVPHTFLVALKLSDPTGETKDCRLFGGTSGNDPRPDTPISSRIDTLNSKTKKISGQPARLTEYKNPAIDPGMMGTVFEIDESTDVAISEEYCVREWPTICKKFPGEWIAIRPEGIVAHSDSIEQLRLALPSGRGCLTKWVPSHGERRDVEVGPDYSEHDFSTRLLARRTALRLMTIQWASLIKEHFGEWVAFDRRGMIGCANSLQSLQEKLTTDDLGTAVIRQVCPEMAPGRLATAIS